MPLLACSVAGNAISFDLASRGTALTLRLRDSFQPLTCGLSPAFLAAPPRHSHQHFLIQHHTRCWFSAGKHGPHAGYAPERSCGPATQRSVSHTYTSQPCAFRSLDKHPQSIPRGRYPGKMRAILYSLTLLQDPFIRCRKDASGSIAVASFAICVT